MICDVSGAVTWIHRTQFHWSEKQMRGQWFPYQKWGVATVLSSEHLSWIKCIQGSLCHGNLQQKGEHGVFPESSSFWDMKFLSWDLYQVKITFEQFSLELNELPQNPI